MLVFQSLFCPPKYETCHNLKLFPKLCPKDSFSALLREKVNIVDYPTDCAADPIMFGEDKLCLRKEVLLPLVASYLWVWGAQVPQTLQECEDHLQDLVHSFCYGGPRHQAQVTWLGSKCLDPEASCRLQSSIFLFNVSKWWTMKQTQLCLSI